MATNFDKAAQSIFNDTDVQKLSGKKDALQQLANSADGQKVKALLDQNGSLQSAMEQGDMEALKSAVSGILKTEAGANLARQINEMMKS